MHAVVCVCCLFFRFVVKSLDYQLLPAMNNGEQSSRRFLEWIPQALVQRNGNDFDVNGGFTTVKYVMQGKTSGQSIVDQAKNVLACIWRRMKHAQRQLTGS
jgi:hypothetical protein